MVIGGKPVTDASDKRPQRKPKAQPMDRGGGQPRASRDARGSGDSRGSGDTR